MGTERVYKAYDILSNPQEKVQLVEDILDKLAESGVAPGFSVKQRKVDLAGIISLAISGSDDVYFANIIYGKLSNKITKNECSMDLSLALKDLILKNVELGHHETALEIWRNSKDLKYVFDDPDVHLSFLGNLNGHYADLFLREANLDESKREIVDALIRVVGSKDSELLECIMLKIGSPVRRSTLSALFEAFLKQRKDAESEKVLQSIFKTRTGLAPQDFSQIAKKVLEVNDVEKAIDMASSYHIKISGGGYVHIFEHILMNEEPQKYNAFFNTMVEKMKDADNDSRSLLFPILVRYLSIKYHVRLSRSFISSMVKNFHTSDSTPDISELPDLGKYSLTNDIYNVIYFSPSSFQKGLVVLLEEALKSKELDIVKWCITELRQEGFLVQEILSLIKNFNPSLFRELFHEDIENSIR
ncbi:hypothetical protein PSN45_004429 [Yamadazyma tenuis]|uniref:uncharacterized protein n=1 Tax=Candida tenuis TaxID=2315449 RepID=UPI0027A673B8|nr:hypothetical protein PSN45_004429 [Yamadazyma tenuis]